MSDASEFAPDWVSPPGDTVSDLLKARDLAPRQLAQLLGRPEGFVDGLLHGKEAITPEVAAKLARALGSSTAFWSNREAQFQVARRRQETAWIRELPIASMRAWNWILTDAPADLVAACLDFFGVESVGEWRARYDTVLAEAAFKTSPTYDSEPGAVAAWLRRGQIVADDIACQPWDAAGFQTELRALRGLTRRKDPAQFLPELERRCAAFGVAVAVVRGPAGCRASGATRFLNSRKALLLLSFRYLSDDHFWFAFFHEAAHLVLHGEKGFFLEGSGRPHEREELEASEFAAKILIPPEHRDAMLRLPNDYRAVMRFAMDIDVAAGVVVGQLQHHQRIGQQHLNRLKVRYDWPEDDVFGHPMKRR